MFVFRKQEHGEIGRVDWVQILELASPSCVILGKLFISLSLTGFTYKVEIRRLVTIHAEHIVASDITL